MISFENVTKKFLVGTTALSNISFSIAEKEFVFLVGPSGAGKTTILKLLLREYPPTSGVIKIDDLVISSKKFSEIEKLRQKIGIIFQDFKILPEKNIFENIAISLQIKRVPPYQIREEVKKTLKLVGLENKENMFPLQLSAGELQRIAIARAIIGERDIILADEPTGNLDPKTAWEIMRIFKKLEKKKTILFATHNTDIVNSMQKRVLLIKEGTLTKDVKKGGYEL